MFPAATNTFLLSGGHSLGPGLFTPQNVLTAEWNTKPGSAAAEPGAGHPASPPHPCPLRVSVQHPSPPCSAGPFYSLFLCNVPPGSSGFSLISSIALILRFLHPSPSFPHLPVCLLISPAFLGSISLQAGPPLRSPSVSVTCHAFLFREPPTALAGSCAISPHPSTSAHPNPLYSQVWVFFAVSSSVKRREGVRADS